MADKTGIEWTDATWNPLRGCTRVSEGCRNCYAERVAARFSDPGAPYHGLAERGRAGSKWTGAVVMVEGAIDQPLRWKRPRRIFVNSMSDLFHERVPDEWIDRIFAVMALSPQHAFQVLTKRADRMRAYMANAAGRVGDAVQPLRADNRPVGPLPHLDGGERWWPLPNVWLGVSVENQAAADERIPELLATPATVRFVSAEPLLGSVDLRAGLGWRASKALPQRNWDDFGWPSWVPADVRQQIESFWNPEWNRGPNAWLRGAIENGQPPLGTRGKFRRCTNAEDYVEGRFVPAWNNIGRVVDDKGAVHVVSAGTYQSRPGRLDWVICGGESGPQARPMHPDWARSLRDQCAAAGVPFFFKQHGEWIGVPDLGRLPGGGGPGFGAFDHCKFDMEHEAVRVGKKAAGALIDGREHREWPMENGNG